MTLCVCDRAQACLDLCERIRVDVHRSADAGRPSALAQCDQRVNIEVAVGGRLVAGFAELPLDLERRRREGRCDRMWTRRTLRGLHDGILASPYGAEPGEGFGARAVASRMWVDDLAAADGVYRGDRADHDAVPAHRDERLLESQLVEILAEWHDTRRRLSGPVVDLEAASRHL